MAWYIKAGLGGGYGGISNMDWEAIDAETKKEAWDWAYEQACQEYESYGVFDYEVFREENPDATEEDEWMEYEQDRESWIYYLAEEFDTNPNED